MKLRQAERSSLLLLSSTPSTVGDVLDAVVLSNFFDKDWLKDENKLDAMTLKLLVTKTNVAVQKDFQPEDSNCGKAYLKSARSLTDLEGKKST